MLCRRGFGKLLLTAALLTFVMYLAINSVSYFSKSYRWTRYIRFLNNHDPSDITFVEENSRAKQVLVIENNILKATMNLTNPQPRINAIISEFDGSKLPVSLPMKHDSVVPAGCHTLNNIPPQLRKTSITGIPNLLHLIYANPQVPEQYYQLIQQCVKINGPDMIFVLWTNDDARIFLETLEKERKQTLFDGLNFELERSDVLRYIVLHHYGGMYMDMDEECVQPLWPVLNQHSCLLDQEEPTQSQLWHGRKFIAMNSAMACRPAHPFFKTVLTELASYVNKPGNVIDRTGPLFLTDVYNRYVASNPTSENAVTLMPSSAFSPFKDPSPSVLNDFRERCKDTARLAINPIMQEGCNAWAKEGFGLGDVVQKRKGAFLIHKFLHLGHLGGYKDIHKRINLCDSEDTNLVFYRFRSQ